jgi:hypothetical protein
MSECVNWPILLAIVGAALGLFLILLLAGGLLMRCLDARGRADADRLPVVAKNGPETGFLDCAPHLHPAAFCTSRGSMVVNGVGSFRSKTSPGMTIPLGSGESDQPNYNAPKGPHSSVNYIQEQNVTIRCLRKHVGMHTYRAARTVSAAINLELSHDRSQSICRLAIGSRQPIRILGWDAAATLGIG